jgi:hypothetical protein
MATGATETNGRRIPCHLSFVIFGALIVGVGNYFAILSTIFQIQSPDARPPDYASANNTATREKKAPNIQVFVTMSPAHGEYWERFYENSNGWHTQFPGLRAYTFDRVVKDSLLRDANIHSMELLEGEYSQKHSNLLLAAFEHVWKDNNQSEWYFMTEDDTVLMKDNLMRLVQTLNSRNDLYMGKCVFVPSQNAVERFLFAVGGSGILMSHTLLRKMAPNVAYCREEYATLEYGDARIAACVDYSLGRPWTKQNISSITCPSSEFSFTNGLYDYEVKVQPPHRRIITLHNKDPVWLGRFNEAANTLGSNLTWGELRKYLNETATS